MCINIAHAKTSPQLYEIPLNLYVAYPVQRALLDKFYNVPIAALVAFISSDHFYNVHAAICIHIIR